MGTCVKITSGELRPSGVWGILIYCSDYRCSHSIAMPADKWPYPTLSHGLSARHAVSEVRMSGRTLPRPNGDLVLTVAAQRKPEAALRYLRAVHRLLDFVGEPLEVFV
jgi:hypothetical protein